MGKQFKLRDPPLQRSALPVLPRRRADCHPASQRSRLLVRIESADERDNLQNP